MQRSIVLCVNSPMLSECQEAIDIPKRAFRHAAIVLHLCLFSNVTVFDALHTAGSNVKVHLGQGFVSQPSTRNGWITTSTIWGNRRIVFAHKIACSIAICSVITFPFIVFEMAWAWQQWLSPRPKQRSITNMLTAFPHLGDAALYEPLSKPNGLWVVRETHYIKNPLVKAGLSGPPL